MKTRRKTILWSLALLAAAVAVGAEQPVDVTRAVAVDASISIEAVAGSIKVVGIDGAELRITGTLGDDVEELAVRGEGRRVSIEVVVPRGGSRGRERKIAADLEVRVPRGVKLEVDAVSASVEVSGVSGRIEAASVSGAVSVAGGANGVEAESVSGAVSVTGAIGPIDAESVSGKVTLDEVSGDVEASTVSGAIGIDAGTVGDVEAESVSGDVRFKGSPHGGRLKIESHSGNVEVLLPANVSARFELETFSGRIDNGFGPPAERADRYESGWRARFTTGAGDTRVSVETFSGSIVLQQL